ncbi:MAG: glycosyltransferase family A protein [Ilumatobacteraceae bacterium]
MLTRAKQLVIDRLGISRVARANDEHAAELARLTATVEHQAAMLAPLAGLPAELCAAQARTGALESTLIAHGHVIDSLHAWKAVAINSALLGVMTPVATPISVVMATRNRVALCDRAVRSVLAQRHQQWQLVVIDDGSTDGTGEMVAALGDARITIVRTEGVGAAAARNTGLTAATGEWVAFLDDDNVMDPAWLQAVAVHAARQPSVHAFYGAQLRQHETTGEAAVASSMLFATATDLTTLSHDNRIDLGALAVRRSSPELRFDAALPRFIDWDLVVRVQAAHGFHPITAWSGVYTTEASSRISEQGGDDALVAFRARLADSTDPVGSPAAG